MGGESREKEGRKIACQSSHINTKVDFITKILNKDYYQGHFELNENENSAYQNLWNVAKAVLRRKWIALNTLEKYKYFQSVTLASIIRELEKKSKLDSK